MNLTDRMLCAVDSGMRTLFAVPRAARATPAPEPGNQSGTLSPSERRLSGALMRVNHVGEVCAQALYTSQAMTTKNDELRRHLEAAAREETDHLAWTSERLEELGDRPSLLNPLWYAGAFTIGLVAGRLGGDALSLGFVVETERQVAEHLGSHLERLPEHDMASRVIVAQMQQDEAAHADAALHAGAAELPLPVRGIMRVAARVMTGTAHYV